MRKNPIAAKSITDPSDEVARVRFRELCMRLQSLLAKEGVMVRSFVSETLPLFTNLSDCAKKAAVAALENYVLVCEDVANEGESLRNTRSLSWRMLRQQKLRPRADLFMHITDEHVVEFYDLEHKQIFRNLRFFEISSYSLEELYCTEWWNLFRREDEITRQLAEIGRELVAGKRMETFCPEVRAHVLEEISSSFRFRVEMELLWGSPLMDGHRVAGYAVVEDAKLLNPPDSRLEEEGTLESFYRHVPTSEAGTESN